MVAPIRPHALEALRQKMIRETEQHLNRLLGNPVQRHAARPAEPNHASTRTVAKPHN